MKRALNGKSVFGRGLLGASAVAMLAVATASPAFADPYHGRHYRPYAGHGSYYGGPYRGHYRYYDYRRHRGHLSGGEAALIAAGIIGGIILIDSARRQNAYQSAYARNRAYDDYGRYDNYRRPDPRADDYYYRRDDSAYGRAYDSATPYENGSYEDRAYDRGGQDGRYSSASRNGEELLGGPETAASGDRAASGFPVDAAFRECVAETRGAAGAGGMIVAMPGAPTEVTPLADGAVRMSAQFRASNARGDSWTRRFVCEADGGGVRFLQVD